MNIRVLNLMNKITQTIKIQIMNPRNKKIKIMKTIILAG